MGPEVKAVLGLDTGPFTAALDSASSGLSNFTAKSVESIEQSVQSTEGLARGIEKIGRLFAAGFGVERIIKEFISLSEYADKFGDKTDENVRAAAEWGRQWAETSNDIKDGLVQMLGFLATAGDYWGDLIAKAVYGAEQVKKANQAEQDANAAEKRLAASKEINKPEELARVRAEIAQKERDEAYEKAGNYGKLTILINEAANLKSKENDEAASVLDREKAKLALIDNEIEKEKLLAKIKDEQAASDARIIRSIDRSGEAKKHKAAKDSVKSGSLDSDDAKAASRADEERMKQASKIEKTERHESSEKLHRAISESNRHLNKIEEHLKGKFANQ
jgi:hypothetical protein